MRELGPRDYVQTLERQRRFTEARVATTVDELWLLEHAAVFTLGQAGRREHVLDAGSIPVLASDRGGQVTYHGRGQLVAYVLMDLRRKQLGVRHLVEGLEQCVIDMLAREGVEGVRRERAPGVYVSGAKICALGLRIRSGCSYHGLALNVDMDLEPFERIDPCGYAGLAVTQTRDLGIPWNVDEAGERLVSAFAAHFAYRARRRHESMA